MNEEQLRILDECDKMSNEDWNEILELSKEEEKKGNIEFSRRLKDISTRKYHNEEYYGGLW